MFLHSIFIIPLIGQLVLPLKLVGSKKADLLIDSMLALVVVLAAQGAAAAVLLLDRLWCEYFLGPDEATPPLVVPSLLSKVVFLSSIWSSPRFLSRKFSRDAVRRRLGRTGALDLNATLMYLKRDIV